LDWIVTEELHPRIITNNKMEGIIFFVKPILTPNLK